MVGVTAVPRPEPAAAVRSDEDAAAVAEVGGLGGEQYPAGRAVAALAQGARLVRVDHGQVGVGGEVVRVVGQLDQAAEGVDSRAADQAGDAGP
jgi:hypothetical protein